MAIRKDAEGGEKTLPEFVVDIKDEAGKMVARVRKVLYVRLKSRPAICATMRNSHS